MNIMFHILHTICSYTSSEIIRTLCFLQRSAIISISFLWKTFPSGLFGLLKMIALVFSLNKEFSSASSSSQSAEVIFLPTFSCFGVKAINLGVPPANRTYSNKINLLYWNSVIQDIEQLSYHWLVTVKIWLNDYHLIT